MARKKASNPEEQTLPPSGLGDVIKKVANPIAKILNLPVECEPCKKRQLKANKLFNWLTAKRDITDEEKVFLHEMTLIIINKGIMINEDREKVFKLYNDITKSNVKACVCPGLVKVMVERLNAFLE